MQQLRVRGPRAAISRHLNCRGAANDRACNSLKTDLASDAGSTRRRIIRCQFSVAQGWRFGLRFLLRPVLVEFTDPEGFRLHEEQSPDKQGAGGASAIGSA